MASLIQQAIGSTGSSTAATITPTLDAATAAGNALIIVVVADTTVVTPIGFDRDVAQVNNDGHYVFRKSTDAGETSWTVTLGSTSAACWWAAEISGLAADPLDAASTSTGSSGQASTFATGATGTIARADSLLLASVGTSAAVNPGRTVTAWTNSFAAQKTTSTSKASGTNVGLGVAVLFPDASGTFETTATTGQCAHTAALTVYSGASPTTARDTVFRAGQPRAGWAAGEPRAAWMAAELI